jgi:hypothetical protein
MDQFSIPERLEPVAPAEPTQRQGFSSDQRRRRNQEQPRAQVQNDEGDPSQNDDDLHNVDELA